MSTTLTNMSEETSIKAIKTAKTNYIGRHIALSKEFNTSISSHYEKHKSSGGKTNAFQIFMKSPQKVFQIDKRRRRNNKGICREERHLSCLSFSIHL